MKPQNPYFLQVRLASSLEIFGGVWLAASPFVFNYGLATNAVYANARVMGTILVMLGIARLFSRAFRMTGIGWYTTILALWITLSPWILGFSREYVPALNHFFVGIISIALALWSIWASDTFFEHHPNNMI